MKQFIIPALICAGYLAAAPAPAFASSKEVSVSAAHVYYSTTPGEQPLLVIKGKNFNLNSSVLLAGAPLLSTYISSEQLVAYIPESTPAGSYLLTILNGKGAVQEVRFSLAIGSNGPKGDKGDKGDTGAKGDQGVQGIQGEKGDKGDKGETGATGETGPQGIQGEKGEKGDTGLQGIQGIQGDKGETGAQGPAGPQGTKGDKGDKGDPGEAASLPAGSWILHESATSPTGYEFGQQVITPTPLKLYQTLADIPNARTSPGVALIGDEIYVIGGRWQSTTLDIVQAYSITSGQWTTKSSMFQPREGFATAVVNNKIYVMGGYRPFFTQEDVTGRVEEYDPADGQWRVKNNMPVPLSHTGSCVYQGKVYVFGGTSPGSASTSGVYEYNPATDVWTSSPITHMPTTRTSPAVAVIGNKAYVTGGDITSQGNLTDAVNIYDFQTQTWSAGKPLPQAVTLHSAAVANGNLYLLGGAYGSGPKDTVDRLNLATGGKSWTTLDLNLQSATYNGAVVHNGSIYVVGGANGPNYSYALEKITDGKPLYLHRKSN